MGWVTSSNQQNCGIEFPIDIVLNQLCESVTRYSSSIPFAPRPKCGLCIDMITCIIIYIHIYTHVYLHIVYDILIYLKSKEIYIYNVPSCCSHNMLFSCNSNVANPILHCQSAGLLLSSQSGVNLGMDPIPLLNRPWKVGCN